MKRFLIAVILSLSLLLSPLFAHAQLPGWSGLAVFTFPCICSASLWVFYAPLHVSSIPIVGPMTYIPYATIPFLNFLSFVPTVSSVGTHIPAVPACWIYVPPVFCVPLPNIGAEIYVGSGLPGSVK